MKNVDPKYRNISRASVSTSILKIVHSSKTDLKERLSKIDNVAVTLDIWSDRQMRGFMGVTVHYISDSGLQTTLLACERFTGQHTGVRIAEHFETVVGEYGLDGKVTYLVTDKGSNMKRAFATAFPETFDDGVDDDGIWESDDVFCCSHVCCADAPHAIADVSLRKSFCTRLDISCAIRGASRTWRGSGSTVVL